MSKKRTRTTTQTNTEISKVKAKTLAALKKIGGGRGDNGTEYPNGRDSKPPNCAMTYWMLKDG